MKLFRLEVSGKDASKRYLIGRLAHSESSLRLWMGKDHMYLTIHSVKEIQEY